eukprot:6403338-Amphidinium_carterae.1
MDIPVIPREPDLKISKVLRNTANQLDAWVWCDLGFDIVDAAPWSPTASAVQAGCGAEPSNERNRQLGDCRRENM